MTDDSERSVGDPVLDRAVQGDAPGGNGRFGELGERFDRRSPFWIGLVGGLGLVVAYVVWLAITAAAGISLFLVLAPVIAIGLDPVVTQLQRLRAPRWRPGLSDGQRRFRQGAANVCPATDVTLKR